MKVVISILVGLLALFLSTLSNQGFFDFGKTLLFGAESLGEIDLSFIGKSVDKLMIFPEMINSNVSPFILDLISTHKDNFPIIANQINKELIYNINVFLFYYIFSFAILKVMSFFNFYRDKFYLFLLIVGTYFLILFLA